MSHFEVDEIRRALNQAGIDRSISAPPGQVAVSRERVLVELRVAVEDSALVDKALEEIGGNLLVLEKTRSMSLTLGERPQLKKPPPPVLFYLVPKGWLAT